MQIERLNTDPGPKSVWEARQFVTVLRNCLEINMAMLQANYLHGTNFHNHLSPYRQFLDVHLTQEEANKIYVPLVKKLHDFMMTKVFLPILENIFEDKKMIMFTDLFSTGGLDIVFRMFLTLVKGGFKDPYDIFSIVNLKRFQGANYGGLNRTFPRTITREDLNPHNV